MLEAGRVAAVLSVASLCGSICSDFDCRIHLLDAGKMFMLAQLVCCELVGDEVKKKVVDRRGEK